MITTTDFGTLCDGRTVRLYTLKNDAIELSVTDYGSTLVRLLVPDKNGKLTDIVLGYDDLAGYVADDTCFGNNVGRSANRIGGASFTLNGTEYKLAANDGENNLHSGPDSYSKRIWDVAAKTDTSITFSLESPHMDQGFPGALTMSVTYEISGQNEEPAFSITYEAAPDQDTLISMTHHSYYNLNGEGSGDILNHRLRWRRTSILQLIFRFCSKPRNYFCHRNGYGFFVTDVILALILKILRYRLPAATITTG